MAHLALSLLGPFQATLDGASIEGLGSRRLQALLAYLAVEGGREHPREHLATLLWPERSDHQALGALRYALSNLHRALDDRHAPSPFLLTTRYAVQFNPASDHTLDVATFEGLARRPDRPSLERAASLYRGPFLQGLSVAACPALDDWLLLKGEAYQRVALSVSGRLTELAMMQGHYAQAANWARRQLELEPYWELAHRQLMLALASDGARTTALAHYEGLRRLLGDELGCEPEDATRALYEQLRTGLTVWPPAPVRPPPPAALTFADAGQPPVDRLVARERELARLSAALARANEGRGGLALIVGEAGRGKTALLEGFVQQAAQAHHDLLALFGRCNAHGGMGEPYLPFREMLQSLTGQMQGETPAAPVIPVGHVGASVLTVAATLVEHGPDLLHSLVSGEALLRRVERLLPLEGGAPAGAPPWVARLRELVRAPAQSAASILVTGPGLSSRQGALFSQLTLVLRTLSVSAPLILVVDDLQWADGGTMALLFHLARRLVGSRILLLCAFRPEALHLLEGRQPSVDGARESFDEAPPDVGAVLHELIREWGDVLINLAHADGRAFVEAYLDSEPNCLRASFRRALYDHTGGNPLFTVELLRSFQRAGALGRDAAGRWIEAATPDWGHWPPQVEAVIATHLAALPDQDRLLLQAASVQGEHFVAEVVARVLSRPEGELSQRLSGPLRMRHRLVEAVGLDRLAVSGQPISRYRFRHALLQQGAYNSLDLIERSRLHEATGRALESLYLAEGEQPEALSPNLAHHYEAAGLPLRAARYRLAAGRWANLLSAHDEAVAHVERGLALLEQVAASPERLPLELELRMLLVNAALLREGWQAPAYRQAAERLSDLVEQVNIHDYALRLAALSMLAVIHVWSADPERGRRVGEQLLRLAAADDQHSRMLAHWVLGHSLMPLGQLKAAREHLERAMALHNSAAGLSLNPVMGVDPAAMGRAMLGLILWALGYADQGRTSLQQALQQAQALEQAPAIAFVEFIAGIVYAIAGNDAEAALAHGATMRRLGQAGLFYRGFADVLGILSASGAQGEAREGRQLEGQRLDSAGVADGVSAVGGGLGQASVRLVRAQIHRQDGEASLGLREVDLALAWIERTGVCLMEAEAWRVRGELLLAATDDGARFVTVERCFWRALAVARRRGMGCFVLRSALSLARFLRAQGRHAEAHTLLSDVYAGFTEGFDTVDMRAARELLAQLTAEQMLAA